MNPFDVGYYNERDLEYSGFKSLGRNVQIAKNCLIVGLENISINDNVRIDGYTTIIASCGFLDIGSFIHIGSYCLLSANSGIILEDFAGISQAVRIYSRTDDYTGQYMTNPTVPEKFTGSYSGTVILKRHVIIGSGSVILPNIIVGKGSSVGALSLVKSSLQPWGIYAGCPVRRIGQRSRNIIKLESELKLELIENSFVKV